LWLWLSEVLHILSRCGRMCLGKVLVRCLWMGLGVLTMLHGLRLRLRLRRADRSFGRAFASGLRGVLRRRMWHLLMFELR